MTCDFFFKKFFITRITFRKNIIIKTLIILIIYMFIQKLYTFSRYLEVYSLVIAESFSNIYIIFSIYIGKISNYLDHNKGFILSKVNNF